jgi:uncharacterized membrane protein
MCPWPEVTGMPARDTARVEAFSDGVFAISITLLILGLFAQSPSSGRVGQTCG